MRLLLFIFVLCLPGFALANARLPGIGCSAAFFRMEGMTLDQNALVLTAGHCANLGSATDAARPGMAFPGPRQVLLDQPYSGQVDIRGTGGKFRRYHYSQVILATMTGMDVAILQLDVTYRSILAKQKDAKPFDLSRIAPSTGAKMRIESARWNADFTCEVEKLVPAVKEGPWTWTDIVRFRFTPLCIVYGGVSGSPVLDADRRIVAVANTRSDAGTPCAVDAPCEIEAGEGPTVGPPGQSYATPTHDLYDCYDFRRRSFDFGLGSCRLLSADPSSDALAGRGGPSRAPGAASRAG